MIGEKKKVKLFNGRYKLVTLVTLDAHGVMSRKQPLAGYKAPLPDLGASSGLQTKFRLDIIIITTHFLFAHLLIIKVPDKTMSNFLFYVI